MGTPQQAGEAIVSAMSERYSRFRTYRDRGAVHQELRTEGPTLELPFETAYVRPNLFRFAFGCPHPFPPLRHLVTRCVVGCDGDRSYLCMEHPGEPADLQITKDTALVVGGATGISGGSAHTIARLLLPGVDGLALTDLRDWTLCGTTLVDDITCHRVVGVPPSGEQWEILVEKESLLLRSLSHSLGGVRTQRQIRHDIQVDGEIPAETFVVPDRRKD